MTLKDKNFLHTTHRTVSWVNKANKAEELVLSAPFQRNPVWTHNQMSFLIDTILQGLPIPELYMMDIIGSDGSENYVVVDGQQRIRACLDFIFNNYALEGEEVQSRWRGLRFDDLGPDEKKTIFSYKFVVRILPAMKDEEIRQIFTRLNRNVVALNNQELRNATYWGPFIKAIQKMADEDEFWSNTGIFSANDHRRMIDHEFISELAIAYLHGDQNKKEKLDYYYQLYEESFEGSSDLIHFFSKVTGEISTLLPELNKTRWRKKSDFYTLFLSIAKQSERLPFSSDERDTYSQKILALGENVDELIRLDENDWAEAPNALIVKYTKTVTSSASDKGSRIARAEVFESYVFS